MSLYYFYEKEGDIIASLSKASATTKGNGKWGPEMLRAFLARTQETQGEVVKGKKYSHTSSLTKNNYNFI